MMVMVGREGANGKVIGLAFGVVDVVDHELDLDLGRGGVEVERLGWIADEQIISL